MPRMRAVQVKEANGPFELVERDVPSPAPGQVLLKVQACGVCHSDVFTKTGAYPGIEFPRVPGHEVVGIIEKVGERVPDWREGQRVGVGWHGGHCGHCPSCRRGDFITCRTMPRSRASPMTAATPTTCWRRSRPWRRSPRSWRRRRPRRCSARGSPPTMPCATAASGREIWWPCSASAVSAISACSSPPGWAAAPSPLPAAPTSSRWRKSSAPTTTSTATPRTWRPSSQSSAGRASSCPPSPAPRR